MIRACFPLLLALAAPSIARAQLALFTVNPDASTGTQIGAAYQVGNVAAGTSLNIRLRAKNQGTVSVTVSKLAISGPGFTIVQTPSIPFVIAPGAFQDVYVQFTGTTPASYSANFQINSISVILVATVVNAATLTVQSPCTGPDATGAINFGNIQSGQTVPCVLSLQNKGAQSLTISTVSLAGQGFQFPQIVQTPVILPAGGSSSFTVAFAPGSGGTYSGTLTVDARSYPLAGTAFVPPLPTPQIQFDAGAPASGQQRIVTMNLPTPSPVSASGTLQISFKSGTAVVTDDPAVVFTANGTRAMPFTIKTGDTQFLLQGQSGAVFQTGTTSGAIGFSASVNGPVAGTATASMTVPATPLAVDHAIATSRSGDLDIQVWGYDNTYSAGGMSFTFYDLNGNVIQPGAVQTDFTQQFRTYFTTGNAGSAFQMRVSFPVTGDSNQILAVDVQLTNSSGTTTIQHLDFQCAGGTCPVTSR